MIFPDVLVWFFAKASLYSHVSGLSFLYFFISGINFFKALEVGLTRLSNKCLGYAEFCSTLKYLRHLDTKQWAIFSHKAGTRLLCSLFKVNSEQRIYKGNTRDAEWAARHTLNRERKDGGTCFFQLAHREDVWPHCALPSPDLSVTMELGVHDGLCLKENNSQSLLQNSQEPQHGSVYPGGRKTSLRSSALLIENKGLTNPALHHCSWVPLKPTHIVFLWSTSWC